MSALQKNITGIKDNTRDTYCYLRFFGEAGDDNLILLRHLFVLILALADHTDNGFGATFRLLDKAHMS